MDWPGEANLGKLTRAAVPLFIFAATLCRFINDRYLGNPDELLQSVLNVAGTGQGSKLDMTYSPVLRQQVLNRSGSERLDIIESFRLIVGTIVTLANPLSMRALALLIDVHVKGHSREVNSVVFSHDSKKVASASNDKTIRIWNAETGECERELKGHSREVNSVVFSHDSKKVASGSYDKTIRIWNAETGECERVLKGHGHRVTSVVFSHDSKKVASGSIDKTIRIWNAETGECERELKGHSDWVSSVVFSHDSKKVASGSNDKTIRIWNAETGECERVLKGHSGSVISVVFSHDSKKVASASHDKTVRIWNAETGECERVLKGHSREVNSVVFSHDSKKVASGSIDKTIRIWNAETGECEKIVPLYGYAHVSSFATDGRGIVTDRGVFALTGGSQPHAEPAMLRQSSVAPILACTDGTWIIAAGEDLLWLPPECRNGQVAVSGSIVVVGCQLGRVLVLGISMAEVEQWTDT
ncbi:hypothetical protein HZS61_008843 [Fusarium oxysporum f. sp. conglutinans]|uniref:Vegetative incompatibility protein HET-E-1 n=1 Tax=Fusarium oxysporum f. sp. conglutinans TaxID=100902 RepID=A0A8H6LRY6_FUSOX|nr:hypothetical protein HZS61_008843 [Fusarium oxysporum f. sp. conglutinans]